MDERHFDVVAARPVPVQEDDDGYLLLGEAGEVGDEAGHPFQRPAKSGWLQMESVAAFTVLGGCFAMESLAELL